MTETEVNFQHLKERISHLAEVSEHGWVLKWGDTPATSFELVCRGTSASQVLDIDRLLTEAHQKAALKFSPASPQ